MAAGLHDHHLYLSLLEEARYFQIPRLQSWLEGERYLEAVTVSLKTMVREMDGNLSAETSTLAGTTIKCFPSWGTKKVYICPRGTSGHRGRPDLCGRRCEQVRGDDSDPYEEELCLRIFTVSKSKLQARDLCSSSLRSPTEARYKV
ncbi:hypothetical protein B0T25DRAFT_551131 [Lasiosphaeria hispida]|uniref:Uncharacterized protein n=1 Tax=Lasiosphaeria hispida TaxID=260671 RepID=A0AAJ0HBF2_9PEZI|nr:hypothetical protein B0T25DRAFT_551131 [Lasiosphaeria hispida]